MKDYIKLAGTIIGGIIGAGIPIYTVYCFWTWALTQIPPGEYAGLIKVGLSLLMFCMGGSITIALTMICAMAVGGFIAWATNL